MHQSISAVYVMQIAILALLGLLLMMPQAVAQDRPCAEDMAQYCGAITPGGGRLLECYEQQKRNMSRSCVAWAENLKSNAESLKNACSKEIDARCNFEKGDPLEILDCLQGNYIDLSPKCVQKLNQFKGKYPLPVK